MATADRKNLSDTMIVFCGLSFVMGLAQSLVLSADTPYVARLFILDQFNMLMAMAMAALCVERLLVMMLGGGVALYEVHAATRAYAMDMLSRFTIQRQVGTDGREVYVLVPGAVSCFIRQIEINKTGNKMDDKEEVVGSSHEALSDLPDLISSGSECEIFEIKSATPADGDSAHSAATTASQ